MDIKHYLSETRRNVESVLQRHFALPHQSDPRLMEASYYSLSNGGKRLRPFLVYATGTMLGAKQADLDVLAAAIECIHSYSLVHDDLPAMDDDELRRGKPTCHIAFDEATAILAGDGLQTLAFELIAKHRFAVDASKQVEMIHVLAKAAGLNGMVGGQALDLAATDNPTTLKQLERIHSLKTGALLSCAIELGCLAAPECALETRQRLLEYGRAIGLAFQVQDDILDIEGNTETLGKPQGSDLAANKATYPALLGLKGAKDKAEQLRQQAINALAALETNTAPLVALANYIVQRDH